MNWISKTCGIYQAVMVLYAVDFTGCLKVIVFHKSHFFFLSFRDSNQWITMGCQIPMLSCTCCLERVRYVPVTNCIGLHIPKRFVVILFKCFKAVVLNQGALTHWKVSANFQGDHRIT